MEVDIIRETVTTFRVIYSLLGLLPGLQAIFLIAFTNTHFPPNAYNTFALFWHLAFPRIPSWNEEYLL
jgi:hypothetical protein